MKLTQIPQDKLVTGRWYAGRGRNANVAVWTGATFLTVGFTFKQGVVKDEGYYGPAEGCFQPFQLIDEGYTLEGLDGSTGGMKGGGRGWDAHYAKSLLMPTPPGDPKEWKEERPKPRCHHIWIADRTEVSEGGTKKRYFHTCPTCGRTKITTRRIVS